MNASLSVRDVMNREFVGVSESDDLLEDFFVNATEGANDFEVDVDVGLDVIGVMDTIDVTITVGDVVQNGGAA